MSSQSMSAAERIRELSVINEDIAKMIKAAGDATNALTNRKLDGNTLEERQSAFTTHTETYYSSLQAIVSRLRRQAYALEESGIISAEAPTLSTSTQVKAGAPGPGKPANQAAVTQYTEHITNGGLGNLDVGWLNSRGNKVEAEKESELIEEAKSLLEDALKK